MVYVGIENLYICRILYKAMRQVLPKDIYYMCIFWVVDHGRATDFNYPLFSSDTGNINVGFSNLSL